MAKIKLTPEDWILAGMNTLISKGVDAVRVEILSKELGVTRGSFYWHFSGRSEWLNQILEHWRKSATNRVINRFDRDKHTAQDILHEMLLLPSHGEAASRAAAIELAIRAWARRDETARKFVDEVDHQRLTFFCELFQELGFDKNSASNRAFALYSYIVSESLIKASLDGIDITSRAEFIIDKLLQ